MSSQPIVPPQIWQPPVSDNLTPHEMAIHLRQIYTAINQHDSAIIMVDGKIPTSTTSSSSTSSGSTTIVEDGVTSFNSATGAISFFPNLEGVNYQTGLTAYQTQLSDNGQVVVLNDASPIAVALNSSVVRPWGCIIFNEGTGTATLTPMSGTVNGGASVAVAGGSFALVNFDGTNFVALTPAPAGGSVTSVTGVAPIVSSGGTTPAISINNATSSTFGAVKPDNTTITISSGVISAASSGYSLGGALTSGNVSLGAGAGSGATLGSVSGLDGVHQIEITIGTGPSSSSAIWTTTFTTSRGHVTYPQIQCVGVSVAGTFVEVGPTSASATSYSAFVDPGASLVPGTIYVWNVSAP